MQGKLLRTMLLSQLRQMATGKSRAGGRSHQGRARVHTMPWPPNLKVSLGQRLPIPCRIYFQVLYKPTVITEFPLVFGIHWVLMKQGKKIGGGAIFNTFKAPMYMSPAIHQLCIGCDLIRGMCMREIGRVDAGIRLSSY